MKVRFTQSPTGRFNLAYSIGDEATISDEVLAKTLLESGYAVVVTTTSNSEKKTIVGEELETATAQVPGKETRKK